MRVCYFGTFDPEYTRNKITYRALRQAGVEVVECRSTLKSRKKYWDLLRRHWRIRHQYDVMLVGFAGHAIMPIAWLAAKMSGRPVVWDAFFSMYDAMIIDRQVASPKSLVAWKFWIMDWLACRLSDRIVLHTNAQIDFFVSTFKVKQSKFARVMLASDESVMHPRAPGPGHEGLIVHFHGSYLPVQGIPTIIQAAKLLQGKPIQFRLVGRMSKYSEALGLAKSLNLKNVEFIDILPYEKLAEKISEADVCLGAFGETARSKRDFAFKVVESLAMAKPLITSDEAPVREVLTDRKDCLLVHAGDAYDLAEKILLLLNDQLLRKRIASGGYETFKKYFTVQAVGEQLANVLTRVQR